MSPRWVGSRQEIVEQELNPQRIAAGETVELQIPVNRLPIQTSGVESSLQLVARYNTGDHAVEGTPVVGPADDHIVSTYTSHRYVTSVSDFERAFVRTGNEQAKLNGELFRAGQLPQLSELRSRVATVANLNRQTASSFTQVLSLPHGVIASPTADEKGDR